jgi:hypothetical protein
MRVLVDERAVANREANLSAKNAKDAKIAKKK